MIQDHHLPIDIPVRLQPLRSSHRINHTYTYRNLNKCILTNEEKTWLCKEVTRQGNPWFDQLTTKRGLIRRYNLYKNFFRKNLKTYQSSGEVLQRGRPYGCDTEEVNGLLSTLGKRQQDTMEVPKSESREMLSEAFKATAKKRGKVNPEYELVDTRTEESFTRRETLVVSASVPPTVARDKAYQRAVKIIRKAKERERKKNAAAVVKREKAAQALLARQSEKDRYNSLSPEEQKAEKEAKKILREEAKRQKSEAAARKLAEARAFLEAHNL